MKHPNKAYRNEAHEHEENEYKKELKIGVGLTFVSLLLVTDQIFFLSHIGYSFASWDDLD